MASPAIKSDGLKELWSRLRFVLLAIIIYRIGTHIPVPGIDPLKISSLFDQNQGTLLGLFNMFLSREAKNPAPGGPKTRF